MHPLGIVKLPLNHRNIDRLNFFSLANRTSAAAMPYNINYHIAELFHSKTLHIARANRPVSLAVSMSNKIATAFGKDKSKNFLLIL
jgi:hypothetical protein